jgi:hypothetical protein
MAGRPYGTGIKRKNSTAPLRSHLRAVGARKRRRTPAYLLMRV